MNNIDNMNESEVKAILNEICVGMGGSARTASVILTCVRNASRRSGCLSRIENYHSILVDDEDGGEQSEEWLLNWGEDPDKYIETYKSVIAHNPLTERVKVLEDAIKGFIDMDSRTHKETDEYLFGISDLIEALKADK